MKNKKEISALVYDLQRVLGEMEEELSFRQELDFWRGFCNIFTDNSIIYWAQKGMKDLENE